MYMKGRNTCVTKALYTSIRTGIFLNPKLFLSGYGFHSQASGESGYF